DPRLRGLLSLRDARARAARPPHREPAIEPAWRLRGRKPARDSVAMRLDPDPGVAAVVAWCRSSAGGFTGSRRRFIAEDDVRALAVLPIDAGSYRDGGGERRTTNRR